MLTSNCESELQDLMHHIDSMMSSKKRDWEHQIQSLQDRMDIKDKETMLHRATIDQKHKEVVIWGGCHMRKGGYIICIWDRVIKHKVFNMKWI